MFIPTVYRIVTGLNSWAKVSKKVQGDLGPIAAQRCQITRPKDAKQYGNCFIARLSI